MVVSSPYADEQRTVIMTSYDAILANWKAFYGPPWLSDSYDVVNNLRSITISGSGSLKMLRTDSVSSLRYNAALIEVSPRLT